MASFQKRASGYWQVRVRREGYPILSQTFEKRAEGESWARQIESEMDRGVFISRAEAERTTFKTLAGRYENEVLPQKRGGDRDAYRLRVLVEAFGNYSLAAITSSMIAGFRDMRLTTLSPQSVVHEINLLSRIFRTAVMDWGLSLPTGIPTANVRKPSVNNERTRRLVLDEEARLLAALTPTTHLKSANTWVLPIVRLALETAARQSELLSMDWQDVNLAHRVVRLRGIGGRSTKNNDQYRDVPLSSAAHNILKDLGGEKPPARGRVFATTASAVKQSWERAVDRARDSYEREVLLSGLKAAGLTEREAEKEVRKVKYAGGRKPTKPTPPRKRTLEIMAALQDTPLLTDLHFHDLRHEGTSRLAEKLQMHELMKVTGHKSTRMLARYYHPKAEDLAKKLG